MNDIFENELKRIDEKEKAKSIEDKVSLAFKDIAETKNGKIVLKAILDMCPLNVSCFSQDSNVMSFNCGRQSFGIELRNYLKVKFSNDLLNDIENTEF